METITQNITKSLFVLMGKLTGLAETLKSYPAEEQDEYREQMRELGSDAGTFLRVIFAYETPENAAKIAKQKQDEKDEMEEAIRNGTVIRKDPKKHH